MAALLRFVALQRIQQLSELKNVEQATLEDLHLLGIHTVEELSNRDPTTLFHEVKRRTQAKQDSCVWDVFAAIIHEASSVELTALTFRTM